jgi:iron complex outermembrane receptor protein
MTKYMMRALVGSSVMVIATAAAAQDAQTTVSTPQATSKAQDSTGVPAENAAAREGVAADIIVTARRKDESLQDVPQTVNAVTGNTLEKLNIQHFEDVQSIVPGLTLSSGSNGYTTAATLRGASFQVESGATPTVEFYLNDALIQSLFLFQSIYDIGQIEVLKGPQGTLRGRASPSGSITVTTRRPDLEEFGGYVDMTGTSRGGINANAAVNVPLIADVLAVRIAGIVDENENDDSHSIANGTDPYARSKGGRASVRFEPTDWFKANVTYQHQQRKQKSYAEVESFSLVNPAAPPTNPIIEASDRDGLTDGANHNFIKQDLVTANLEARFAGQVLSYVGSYSKSTTTANTAQDLANAFPGFEFGQNIATNAKQYTHELRLSSEERLFGIFDYTIGAFHSDFKVHNEVTQQTEVVFPLGGGQYLPVATVNTPITTAGRTKETSVFANLTAHIGDKTELSGGVRHIDFENTNALVVSGNTLAIGDGAKRKDTPTVYNFSLSHRFNDSVLAYANTGSSFRQGPFAIGIFRPLTEGLDPFVDLKPETSKSYEVGVKSNFLDKRLRVNLAGFHQDFKNFIYRGALVNYVNQSFVNGGFVDVPSTFNFLANVPAKISGLDLDAAFQVTKRFSVGAAVSYAKGKIKNGLIACNDLNGDGIPDAAPGSPTAAQIRAGAGGNAVASCRVNDRLSFAPTWNLTAQSEYDLPISDKVDGYLRGLFTYYPNNPNDPENQYDTVKAYGLLNVYLGIRAPNGAWEVSLFSKNITNTGRTLSRNDLVQQTGVQVLLPPTFRTTAGTTINSGYVATTYTAPREFGLNLRFAFGSR